jgi:hypothetical protein
MEPIPLEIGGASLANVAKEILLPAGEHSIERSERDLFYCPQGLSIGDTVAMDGEALAEATDPGGAVVTWENDEGLGNDLDWYGSMALVGGVPLWSHYAADTNSPVLFWNVPSKHVWDIIEVTVGYINIAGSADDANLANMARINGTNRVINTLGPQDGNFFSDLAEGDTNTHAWRHYKSGHPGGNVIHPISDTLMTRCPGDSLVILARDDATTADGDAYKWVRMLVKETPVINPTITIEIPGEAPKTLGSGSATFRLPAQSRVKYTANTSGIYRINSH